MLTLRPNCEHCDCDLAPDQNMAYICTFECTFCRTCTEQILLKVCPNFSGNLVEQPVRTAAMLQKYPASTARVRKQG